MLYKFGNKVNFQGFIFISLGWTSMEISEPISNKYNYDEIQQLE